MPQASVAPVVWCAVTGPQVLPPSCWVASPRGPESCASGSDAAVCPGRAAFRGLTRLPALTAQTWQEAPGREVSPK